jgi:hypothetical protein
LSGVSIAAKPDTIQGINSAGGVSSVLVGLVWIQNCRQVFWGDRDLLIVYLVFMPATLDGVMSGFGSFRRQMRGGLGLTAQAAHRNGMRIFAFVDHCVTLRTSREE